VCPSFLNLIGKWAIALDTCLIMLRCDQIIAYVKMAKLLIVSHDSSHTPPKHKKEDDKSSSIDLTMFDTEDDKFSSVDLKIFDTEDSNATDPDDCCHHIEKVSTSIQIFSIFITSRMITN
jgi:hypothetical protein